MLLLWRNVTVAYCCNTCYNIVEGLGGDAGRPGEDGRTPAFRKLFSICEI